MPVPSLVEIRAWIGVPITVVTDAQLQQIVDAETALQAACCRLPSDGTYPAALAQALYRRVAREVSARSLPLGLTADVSEYGPIRLPGYDAEIERLEAPYRVVAVA